MKMQRSKYQPLPKRLAVHQNNFMLTDTTKRKINSLRDILVGVVPSPEQQVNQITNALIYKYMDDMDRQSEKLGGKASFFVGKYEKYAWRNLMDPKLGGQERMNRYVEALETMGTNKNLSSIFRDILKGAFLPYRSPETLNLFLSEIDGFHYDHSEELGNAFEHLLSIMGSQGEAGQFRTPRHIIDFIVAVVDPQKGQSILDPACGTAGFLISAFRHILKNNPKRLKTSELKHLHENIVGYDINPDMTKFSRVNMFLHNFPEPRIHDYDTLSSYERWDENYDIILANPPFMTPKGGIVPHKKFSISANRSEVLFVDYILEHLKPKGRAGIIVPEGVIFQSGNAYKALRKALVEDGLYAVASLPAGAFNPYSGVKTSVLFFDREIGKHSDEVLFVKIEKDGFDLGAQRREGGESDLPNAIKLLQKFRQSILHPSDKKGLIADKDDMRISHGDMTRGKGLLVKRSEIAESGDYNLSGDRYRKNIYADLGLMVNKFIKDFEPQMKQMRKEAVRAMAQHAESLQRTQAEVTRLLGSSAFQELQENARKNLEQMKANLDSKDIKKALQSARELQEASKRKWEIVELGEVCEINPKKSEVKNLSPATEVSFVPMADLSETDMFFTPKEIKKLSDVSGGYTYFAENDVILAKVTPCFENGKSGVARGLKNKIGFGSSEFIVFRASKKILPELIYHFISSNKFRSAGKIQMTGTGGLQRLPTNFVKAFQIPLPPLETQKQIVAEIEAEQKSVEACRELIVKHEAKIAERIGEVWG